MRKQPTLHDATTHFPAKWCLRNERRNSILMTPHYADLGSASDWTEANFPHGMTNPKHYPVLGSDASSVWNFCARFSDITSRRNQWWCCVMLAVFSGWAVSRTCRIWETLTGSKFVRWGNILNLLDLGKNKIKSRCFYTLLGRIA